MSVDCSFSRKIQYSVANNSDGQNSLTFPGFFQIFQVLSKSNCFYVVDDLGFEIEYPSHFIIVLSMICRLNHSQTSGFIWKYLAFCKTILYISSCVHRTHEYCKKYWYKNIKYKNVYHLRHMRKWTNENNHIRKRKQLLHKTTVTESNWNRITVWYHLPSLYVHIHV